MIENAEEFWRKARRLLSAYERRCGPFARLRCFFPRVMRNAERYSLFRFSVFCIILLLFSDCGVLLRLIASIIAIVLVFDILIGHIAIAFVTRSPRDPLRSVALAFFGFIQIVVGFAVLYAVLSPSFVLQQSGSPFRIGVFDSIYFSLLISTTVEFGEISVHHNSIIAKVIIGSIDRVARILSYYNTDYGFVDVEP